RCSRPWGSNTPTKSGRTTSIAARAICGQSASPISIPFWSPGSYSKAVTATACSATPGKARDPTAGSDAYARLRVRGFAPASGFALAAEHFKLQPGVVVQPLEQFVSKRRRGRPHAAAAGVAGQIKGQRQSTLAEHSRGAAVAGITLARDRYLQRLPCRFVAAVKHKLEKARLALFRRRAFARPG